MSNARNLADLISGSYALPIGAASVGTTELEDLGVTAGKLAATLDLSGKTLTLPVGTVPAQTAPTTSEVLSATAGLTVGSVGTYAFLARATLASTITAGTTYAGADLRYASNVTNNTSDNFNGGNSTWGGGSFRDLEGNGFRYFFC